MRHPLTIVFVVLAIGPGCRQLVDQRANIEKAQAQVRRVAEELDKRTTETGVYVRVDEDDIKETDPWGTRVKVSYSQGGVAEMVVVRSAGPDREFQTDDDLTAEGMVANLKGIGEGIKKNAEQTAANAAKGAVRGAVEGVKESIKDLNPFRKENDGADNAKADHDRPNTVPPVEKANP
jgi:hypothetical protein